MSTTRKLHRCSRGHTFVKSSDCRVCPECWSGTSRRHMEREHHLDFPENISAPALRALLNADITRLAQLARCTEAEVMALHGMGPKAMTTLKAALKSRKLAFAKA